jgi:hypothetical protein
MLMTRGSSNWRGGECSCPTTATGRPSAQAPALEEMAVKQEHSSFEDAINKLLWKFRLDSKFVSDRPERPVLGGKKVPNRLSFRGQTMQNRKKELVKRRRVPLNYQHLSQPLHINLARTQSKKI